MEDLHNFWSALVGTFTSIWNFATWMVDITRESGVQPSVPLMACLVAISIIWLGSGFAAATIAEIRDRKRFLHLAGGLILPVIYPFAILLFMPKALHNLTPEERAAKEESKRQEELAARGPSATELAAEQQKQRPDQTDKMTPLPSEQAKKISISRGPVGGAASKPAEPAPAVSSDTHSFATPGGAAATGIPPQFNQRHFSNIATDENGNFRGPFMVETNDSRFLEAIRITNALPEVLVVEIQVEGGKTRSVRLPYSKIVECKLKSEWMGHDPHGH